ncbi:MAG: potassium transporter TrkA [Helicobacteraceae bacterium]|nr:potassium transporter TrkA [Helicobacteraceae bacterium]
MNYFAKLIVNFAYRLHNSVVYKKRKRFFYNILENNGYQYKKYLDIFMMIIILSTIVILVREVKHPIDDFLTFYSTVIVSFLFMVEYLLRFWVYSDTSKAIIDKYESDLFLQREFKLSSVLFKVTKIKLKYVFSIRAIIDLLAILPFFHELRILRIFILFRIFKLFRYTQSIKYFMTILGSKKIEFITLAIFVSAIIFLSGVLIYIMEANDPTSRINTLFSAFYWSLVTISTVGYGDIVPVTDGGQIVAMIIIIFGIGVISFSTSIIVSAFNENMKQIKDDKLVADIVHIKEFYLICGYTEVASLIAAKLTSLVVVLDDDPLRVSRAQEDGYRAICADPASLETYKMLGIKFAKHVKSVLCLRESDVLNVYTALSIRSISQTIPILATLVEKHNYSKLIFAGATKVVYTQELVGLMAREYSGKPIAFDVIDELRSEKGDSFVDELFLNKKIIAKFPTVGDLLIHKFKLLLLGIHRDKDELLFNPKDDIELQDGDTLILIGSKKLLSEFIDSLSRGIIK